MSATVRQLLGVSANTQLGAIGVVVEGDPDDPNGRTVDATPPSGGRSQSTVDSAGNVVIELTGALDRGRQAQGRALKVLMQALGAQGDTVARVPGERDDRGEDALLLLNGNRVTVQIVSLPIDQRPWRELTAVGKTSVVLTRREVIQVVRNGFLRKKESAQGTLLVLDVAQIPGIVSRAMVAEYVSIHRDPEQEFKLLQAWLVGPTLRSTLRIGGIA